jgi:ERCC4-related helicase
VDHWGEKTIWDSALSGVKIAVSTYQVLYDALSHGFVKMGQLSLLIFDEGKSWEKNRFKY